MNEATNLPTLFDQTFAAHRDVRYHQARAAWLLWSDQALTVVTLLASSSAVASLFAAAPETGRNLIAIWFAIGASALGLMQLVYGPAKLAAYHTRKSQEYSALLVDLEEQGDTTADLKRINRRVKEIEKDEIDYHRIVDLVAHNEAAQHLDLPATERYVVGRIQGALRHVWKFTKHQAVPQATANCDTQPPPKGNHAPA